MPPSAGSPKRATNVSLSVALIEEAKRLKLNISEACERGLEEKIAKTRAETWLEQNREALDGWNAYVEEHGLPLESFRLF